MEENMVNNPPLPKNYAPEFLVLTKGKGCFLCDKAGKQYLDFGSGIAVNALGYGRKDLAKIAAKQMQQLIHTSNLYTSPPTLQLAHKMTTGSPFAAVHFGNSGSEANEAAIKYARLYAYKTRGSGHHKLHCLQNCFHGRTMGALSVTPNPKYQGSFQPMLEGVTVSAMNNSSQLETVLDSSYAAVIVEIIQGEGGLDAMTPEFAATLNRLCKKHDIMLIVDEIQTGLARTGTFYAYPAVGLQPDIVSLAKPLAGGLPLSATLIPARINDKLLIGEHGTTFGGGPVTTAVAGRVWDLLSDPGFICTVAAKGEYLKGLLQTLQGEFSFLGSIKGKGLLAGIEANVNADTFPGILTECRMQGLLILRSGANILRLAPPLVITEKELTQGVDILRKVLKKI